MNERSDQVLRQRITLRHQGSPEGHGIRLQARLPSPRCSSLTDFDRITDQLIGEAVIPRHLG
ncbi:hypothetical protein [Streptomyces maoxianensis]|uniref:Uncharacterized protein n=1 Tax=Streptomyces maoxianensis TaxID=1459942 RepID=A0ABV9G1F4_9ACTN